MSQVVSWRTAYGCRTKRRVLLASSRVRKDRVSGRKELVECRWLSRCSLKNSAERRPRAHSLISLRKCSYSTFTIELPGDACASKKTVCLCRGSTFRKEEITKRAGLRRFPTSRARRRCSNRSQPVACIHRRRRLAPESARCISRTSSVCFKNHDSGKVSPSFQPTYLY